MGVSLVAMTYHASQGNESNAENVTEFQTSGLFNALMLVPPVSVLKTKVHKGKLSLLRILHETLLVPFLVLYIVSKYNLLP